MFFNKNTISDNSISTSTWYHQVQVWIIWRSEHQYNVILCCKYLYVFDVWNLTTQIFYIILLRPRLFCRDLSLHWRIWRLCYNFLHLIRFQWRLFPQAIQQTLTNNLFSLSSGNYTFKTIHLCNYIKIYIKLKFNLIMRSIQHRYFTHN